MSRKIMLFLLAAAFLVAAGACGVSSKKDKIPSPQASAKGMGVTAATAAAGVGTFMADFVEQLAAAAAVPKSPVSAKALMAGERLDCDNAPDGYVSVDSVVPFMATAHNCYGNDYQVFADGTTMSGTLLGTVDCITTDNTTLTLPTDFSVTLNGPINIGGVDFTFTGLGMNITGITYGPSQVASDSCAVTEFHNAMTGVLGSSDPVEVSLDFGTGTVLFDVTVDQSSTATIDMKGAMTLSTPCFNGSFNILTVDSMVFPPGSTCPVSGHLQLTGDAVGDVIFPDDCDSPACVLGT
jgi:hypothetical protein